MPFFCRLRVLLLTIAVGTASYGTAAQFGHSFFVEQVHRQEYLGWGEIWLTMACLFVVLPALIVAGATYRFRFPSPNPWLGSKGRLLLIVAAILGLTLGTICGWPK